MSEKEQLDKLTAAYSVITEYIKSTYQDSFNMLEPNIRDTATRCAQALVATVKSEKDIYLELKAVLSSVFPATTESGMITQGPIPLSSYCPHHLYPVQYECWVSYIPESDGLVLGLSKLTRISKLLSSRFVLQEQLASDIADLLYLNNDNKESMEEFSEDWYYDIGLRTVGSAVMLIGTHTCMSCRGINEPGVKTSSVELRGKYWESNLELKFYQAVQNIRSAKTF